MTSMRLFSPITKLLLTGLVFHLLFILAVFDCYFRSPVVNGMQAFGAGQGEAKRLVLIVGDGLRADLLLNLNPFPNIPDAPVVVAPHLRSIIEERGAFGISHTRVPTESRPGHVALIGGMYEDVSAVTKGWKTNPVDFDSVFNRSSHTFSFGSPDILPMFARGASPGRVKTWMYDEAAEDFTKDAIALDTWVLEHLQSLLQNATHDAKLDSNLREEKVVFFLHLLGLDTTGHSYRPRSTEYMRNIQAVDDIVRQTETLLREFYGDDQTAFIFSADHGMSEIGNHGDGDPDNTRTPLIAWGKGVRGPLPEDPQRPTHDAYSQPWNLSHLVRRDVAQADVASLMAALLGIDWPVNGVGVLPDVDARLPGYLNFSRPDGDRKMADALLVNAKVILEQYRVKYEAKRLHTLRFRPFAPLHADEAELPGTSMLSELESLISQGKWDDARVASAKLIDLSLEGLQYLHTYDRILIRAIVIAAYLGWIAYSATFVLFPPPQISLSPRVTKSGTAVNGQPSPPTSSPLALSASAHWVAGAVLAVFWAVFAMQRSPWTFYVYVLFPCFFWSEAVAVAGPNILRIMKQGSHASDASTVIKFSASVLAVTGAMLCMVTGYTHRSVWSAGFGLLGIVWPIVAWPSSIWRRRSLSVGWAASCAATAVFPLLPVNKEEDVLTILSGGLAMVLTAVAALALVPDHAGYRALYRDQILMTLSIMGFTSNAVESLQAKLGLPSYIQIPNWILLLLSIARPLMTTNAHPNPTSKIVMLFLTFSPLFVILSISVEGLFYVAFTITLLLWIEIEAALRPAPDSSSQAERSKAVREYEATRMDAGPDAIVAASPYRPRLDDLRIALFFLFFVQVAFFGTGNVASISSFYLAPVYRLVPIFNPFLMASLLILKIIAPYVILSACFATLNARLRLPPLSLFLVALCLTDIMTITFFFRVTDTGSWLEIGQSITFFCISSLLLVWSGGICAGGEALMADTLRSLIVDSHRKLN